MLTRREMVARLAAVGMVVVLEGCDAFTDLPTAAPFHVAPSGTGTTYYVDSTGSDESVGTSPRRPWRTIERVNQQTLQPGDSVLFQGEQSFFGNLVIRQSGTPGNPITVGSYGAGRATIHAGEGTGIQLLDVGYVRVEQLIVAGSGLLTNNGRGVDVVNSLDPETKLEWIRLHNLEVHGFGSDYTGYDGSVHGPTQRGIGIHVRGTRRDGSGVSGFRDVQITGCEVYDCMQAGIFVCAHWGSTTHFGHENVTIRDCAVHDNPGAGARSDRHSGSGIQVGQTDGGLVEYCRAWENGANNGSAGGPVGIWAVDSRHFTIQFCESHHNRSPTADGGGFDLDGGCIGCIVQYCYAHDNHGPGFLMYRYWDAPMIARDNVIRYNVSQNNNVPGVGYEVGEIHLGGAEAHGAQVYGNTCYLGAGAASIRYCLFLGAQLRNAKVHNNIFVTADGRRLASFSNNHPHDIRGNNYFSSGAAWNVRGGDGTIYGSLEEFRTGTGHEAGTGTDVAPLLTDPGGGGTVGDPHGLAAALTAYRLQTGTAMPTAGIDLRALGLALPPEDFFGNAIPSNGPFAAVGADSAPGEPGPPAGNPKMHTLSDSFSGGTLDPESWEPSGTALGSVVQADGLELHLSVGSSAWAACTSRGLYDLAESHAIVDTEVATGDGVYTTLLLRREADDEQAVVFAYDAMSRMLWVVRRADGASSVLALVPYEAATHRYWRIRESGGTVYWETSANATEWTLHYSEAARIDVTALELRLYMERRGWSPSGQVATIRGVNAA